MTEKAKQKVLIVDDDNVMVETASGILRKAGYDVVAGFDAMQGFMYAQREEPSVILLDLQMPAGGGEQVWDRLKKSNRTQGVPIVVVTARRKAGLAEEMLARGAEAGRHRARCARAEVTRCSRKRRS